MKEVILHVGLHKTGTTTIQRALKGYNQSGTIYAPFEDKNHGRAMHAIFSDNPYDYTIYWKHRGYTERGMRAERAKYLSELNSHIEELKCDRLIYSGEAMSMLRPDEQQRMVAYFRDRGCKVKVIAMVRHPHSWVISRSQERAKYGEKYPAKLNPSFKQRLSGFQKALPKEDFLVFDFDAVVEQGDLIRFFAAQLEIELKPVKSLNRSISLQALALLYRINNLQIDTFGSMAKFKARTIFNQKARQNLSVENGCESLSSLDANHFLHEDTQIDCDWLRANYAIDYPIAFRELDRDELEKKIAQCLDGFNPQIAKVFNDLGSGYNAKWSLDKNLTYAFKQLHRNQIIATVRETISRPFGRR